MPTVVSGNTAAPVVMIGERAAEFVVTKYQEQLRDRFEENGTPSDGSYDANNDKFVTWNGNDPGNDKWDGRWKPWDKHWDKPHDHPYQHVDWHTKNIVNQQPYLSK